MKLPFKFEYVMTSFAIWSIRALHVRLVVVRRERVMLNKLPVYDIMQRERIKQLNDLEKHIIAALSLIYH